MSKEYHAIREYEQQDEAAMIGILRQPGGHCFEEDKLDLGGFQETWIYEEDGVKGFVCLEIDDRISQIICYVAPEHRRKGIGTKLFEHGKERLKDLDPNTIWVFFRSDIGSSAQFYQNRGAQPWYGYHYMVCKADKPENEAGLADIGLEVRNYTEDRFDEYLDMRADAFYKINKMIDARPYDERERREAVLKWTERHLDELYLFYVAGKLVGSITLMEGFFDEVCVAPEYQGRGFGRAIVNWTLGKCVEKGWKPCLCVVTGNTPAIRLYESCGFEIAQTLTMNRLFSCNKEPDLRGPIGG